MNVLNDLGVSTLELRWKALDELAGIGGVPASQFPPVDTSRLPQIDLLFREGDLLGERGDSDGLDLPEETDGADIPADHDMRLEALRLIKRRRGQRQFRNSLLNAYSRRCLVTRCQVESVLEAAHISPYRGPHTNLPANGLLLRADIHTLFDLSLLTVTPDYTVRLAPELRSSAYSGFDTDTLKFPIESHLRPERRMLERHNATCPWL